MYVPSTYHINHHRTGGVYVMKWFNAFLAWLLVGLVHFGYIHIGVALGISAFYLTLLGGAWVYFEYVLPKKDD